MNAILKNSGGCGQESILFEDKGEILVIENKYVVVTTEADTRTIREVWIDKVKRKDKNDR